MERGESLALIRPKNTHFIKKLKPKGVIDAEKEVFALAARQGSFLDKNLEELNPSPYEFAFTFDDDNGKHTYRNGDWEAHAMFFRERLRSSETEALRWMDEQFNYEYPRKGMVFAIGNQAKRPQTWQLLGVIRLDQHSQTEMLI